MYPHEKQYGWWTALGFVLLLALSQMVCPPRMKGVEPKFPDKLPVYPDTIKAEIVQVVGNNIMPRYEVTVYVLYANKKVWSMSLGKFFRNEDVAWEAWKSWKRQLAKERKRRKDAKGKILAKKQSKKEKRRNTKSK